MSDGKHLLIVLAGALAVLLLGGALLVWPNHRETRSVLSEIAELER